MVIGDATYGDVVEALVSLEETLGIRVPLPPELEAVRKDLDDTLRILEEDIYERVERMLTGKMAQGGPNKLKSGSKITKAYLEELPREQWFEIRLKNYEANEQLQNSFKRLKA